MTYIAVDRNPERANSINAKRIKLVNEIEALHIQRAEGSGWDRVDINERLEVISFELTDLNDEYESLVYAVEN